MKVGAQGFAPIVAPREFDCYKADLVSITMSELSQQSGQF